jgi:hypothetical protein
MTGQEGQLDPCAAGPASSQLTVHEELAEQARQLGHEHRAAAIIPFGDAHEEYWDQGAPGCWTRSVSRPAPPMTTLPGGQALVDAYCEALEAGEADGVELGWWRHPIRGPRVVFQSLG